MPNELPAPASMVFLKKLGRVSYSDGEGLPSSGLTYSNRKRWMNVAFQILTFFGDTGEPGRACVEWRSTLFLHIAGIANRRLGTSIPHRVRLTGLRRCHKLTQVVTMAKVGVAACKSRWLYIITFEINIQFFTIVVDLTRSILILFFILGLAIFIQLHIAHLLVDTWFLGIGLLGRCFRQRATMCVAAALEHFYSDTIDLGGDLTEAFGLVEAITLLGARLSHRRIYMSLVESIPVQASYISDLSGGYERKFRCLTLWRPHGAHNMMSAHT